MKRKLLLFFIFSFFLFSNFSYADSIESSAALKQENLGPLSVEIISKTKLNDVKRRRTIPIKMYIPMDAPTPPPVFIFSHAVGGSRHDLTYLGNFLASYGFLGIFIEHPKSNKNIFTEGKSRISIMKSIVNNKDIWEDRTLDLKFILDSISSLQKKFSKWQIPIDFSRIAVAGHELGTIPVMSLAGANISFKKAKSFSDDRVRAFVAIAPDGVGATYNEEAWNNIYRPFMVIVGTDDTRARKSPLWRHDAYFKMPSPDKYLINIKGARRTSYNDKPKNKKNVRAKKTHKVISEITLSFLIAYLMDDAEVKKYMKSYGIMNDFNGLANITVNQ